MISFNAFKIQSDPDVKEFFYRPIWPDSLLAAWEVQIIPKNLSSSLFWYFLSVSNTQFF